MNPAESQMRIAILEDEESHRQALEKIIEGSGHIAVAYALPSKFLREFSRESFDIIMIDWQLPEMSGVDVIEWLRQKKQSTVPIIMLTNRASEVDIVHCLTAGADDYMIKPVRPVELVARIGALQRRSFPVPPDTCYFGRYRIDAERQAVWLDGTLVPLTNKEFHLATLIFRNAGRVVSRGHIWDAVWGRSLRFDTRTMDSYVYRLRTKLKLRPEFGFRVSAIYGHGFRLESVESSASEGDDANEAGQSAGSAETTNQGDASEPDGIEPIHE